MTTPIVSASVKGGKWHRIEEAEVRSFRDELHSLCGVTFEPFNVTHPGALPTSWLRSSWCAKCYTAEERAT